MPFASATTTLGEIHKYNSNLPKYTDDTRVASFLDALSRAVQAKDARVVAIPLGTQGGLRYVQKTCWEKWKHSSEWKYDFWYAASKENLASILTEIKDKDTYQTGKLEPLLIVDGKQLPYKISFSTSLKRVSKTATLQLDVDIDALADAPLKRYEVNGLSVPLAATDEEKRKIVNRARAIRRDATDKYDFPSAVRTSKVKAGDKEAVCATQICFNTIKTIGLEEFCQDITKTWESGGKLCLNTARGTDFTITPKKISSRKQSWTWHDNVANSLETMFNSLGIKFGPDTPVTLDYYYKTYLRESFAEANRSGLTWKVVKYSTLGLLLESALLAGDYYGVFDAASKMNPVVAAAGAVIGGGVALTAIYGKAIKNKITDVVRNSFIGKAWAAHKERLKREAAEQRKQKKEIKAIEEAKKLNVLRSFKGAGMWSEASPAGHCLTVSTPQCIAAAEQGGWLPGEADLRYLQNMLFIHSNTIRLANAAKEANLNLTEENIPIALEKLVGKNKLTPDFVEAYTTHGLSDLPNNLVLKNFLMSRPQEGTITYKDVAAYTSRGTYLGRTSLTDVEFDTLKSLAKGQKLFLFTGIRDTRREDAKLDNILKSGECIEPAKLAPYLAQANITIEIL